MDKKIGAILKQLVETHGINILQDREQLTRLLPDTVGGQDVSVDMILTACDYGIVEKILDSPIPISPDFVDHAVLEIQNNSNCPTELIKWAVETWVEVLAGFTRMERKLEESGLDFPLYEDEIDLVAGSKLGLAKPSEQQIKQLVSEPEPISIPLPEKPIVERAKTPEIPVDTAKVPQEIAVPVTQLRECIIEPELAAQGLAYQIGMGKILKVFFVTENQLFLITEKSAFLYNLREHNSEYEIFSTFLDGDFNKEKMLLAGLVNTSDISVWEITTGQVIKRLSEYHAWKAGFLAISPDGSFIALAGNSCIPDPYYTKSGALLVSLTSEPRIEKIGRNNHELTYYECAIPNNVSAQGLCFCGNNLDVAVVATPITTRDHYVLRVTTHSVDEFLIKRIANPGQDARRFVGHTVPIKALAYDPSNSQIASVDCAIRLWNAQNGDQIYALEGHAGAINCLAFSSDGRYLASGGKDQVICLWDVINGRLLTWFESLAGEVTSLAFSPDGHFLVAVYQGKQIYIWDIDTRKPVSKLDLQIKQYVCPISKSSRQLITYYTGQGKLNIWDWTIGQAKSDFPFEGEFEPQSDSDGMTSYLSAVSPSGKLLARGSNDQFSLFDLENGKIRCRKKVTGTIRNVIFQTNDAFLLLVVKESSDLVIWSLDTNKLLWKRLSALPQERIFTLDFSPDKKYLYIVSGDTIRIYYILQQQLLNCYHLDLCSLDGEISSAVLDTHENLVVTGHTNGIVRVWSVLDGICKQRLAGQHEEVLSVDITCGGLIVASVSKDDQLRVWDVSTTRTIMTQNACSSQSITFSPDGHFIAGFGVDGIIRIWKIPGARQYTLSAWQKPPQFDVFEQRDEIPKVGNIYDCIITRQTFLGVEVEFLSQSGFIPISHITIEPISDCVGQNIPAMLINHDSMGDSLLSNLAVIEKWSLAQTNASLPPNYSIPRIGRIYPAKILELPLRSNDELRLELLPGVFGVICEHEYQDVKQKRELRIGDSIDVMIIDFLEEAALVSYFAVAEGWISDEWHNHYTYEKVILGRIYTGKVVRIADFGAFVEIFPGTVGVIHISQLDSEPVGRVEDVVLIGDEVTSMVTSISQNGKTIRLSRQAVLDGWTPLEAILGQKNSEPRAVRHLSLPPALPKKYYRKLEEDSNEPEGDEEIYCDEDEESTDAGFTPEQAQKDENPLDVPLLPYPPKDERNAHRRDDGFDEDDDL